MSIALQGYPKSRTRFDGSRRRITLLGIHLDNGPLHIPS